jgi:hypothetical protein
LAKLARIFGEVPAIAFSVSTIDAGVAAPVGTRIMTISPACC